MLVVGIPAVGTDVVAIIGPVIVDDVCVFDPAPPPPCDEGGPEDTSGPPGAAVCLNVRPYAARSGIPSLFRVDWGLAGADPTEDVMDARSLVSWGSPTAKFLRAFR